MDEFYIGKVLSGDVQAFRYFIKEYKDMAFSIAMSIVKDEFIAEEVVQDAFLKAFKALASFKKSSKFSTWFYKIVLNEGYAKMNKMKKDFLLFIDNYDEEIIDESFILALEAGEQSTLINQALIKLSPNESVALRLFYLEEESIKDVCAITGWTEANTRVILHRARKNMLGIMNKLIKKHS
ncbi:MAG: sigma-70 family RNA polymerase sigma factor [Ginsengibacter sp.]